jgi:hypothetical protein
MRSLYGDPNRARVRNLRDEPRHLDTGGTGEAARDGYTRLARRPRSLWEDEIVSTESADRIEQFEREYPSPLDLMDSY